MRGAERRRISLATVRTSHILQAHGEKAVSSNFQGLILSKACSINKYLI